MIKGEYMQIPTNHLIPTSLQVHFSFGKEEKTPMTIKI